MTKSSESAQVPMSTSAPATDLAVESPPHTPPAREGAALVDLPAQLVDDEEAKGVKGGADERANPYVTDD